MGATLCYQSSVNLGKMVAGKFNSKLIYAAKKGLVISFIGDNVNFFTRVRYETFKKHAHMVHMFAPVALIHNHHHMSKPLRPQIPLHELSLKNIIPNKSEYQLIQSHLVYILAQLIAEYFPELKPFMDLIKEPERDVPTEKTQYVPFPVLPLNEQYYSDCVPILEALQAHVKKILGEVPECLQILFAIMGDQLTCERFRGSLKLRLGNPDPNDRLANLGPVVIQMFHMAMNFMERAIINPHWNTVKLFICLFIQYESCMLFVRECETCPYALPLP